MQRTHIPYLIARIVAAILFTFSAAIVSGRINNYIRFVIDQNEGFGGLRYVLPDLLFCIFMSIVAVSAFGLYWFKKWSYVAILTELALIVLFSMYFEEGWSSTVTWIVLVVLCLAVLFALLHGVYLRPNDIVINSLSKNQHIVGWIAITLVVVLILFSAIWIFAYFLTDPRDRVAL